MSPNPPDFLETEQDLTGFLECFERGTWPKSSMAITADITRRLLYFFLARCHTSPASRDDERLPWIEAGRIIVSELAPQRDLFLEYYSFDLVRSVEARRIWVEPDLKALP